MRVVCWVALVGLFPVAVWAQSQEAPDAGAPTEPAAVQAPTVGPDPLAGPDPMAGSGFLGDLAALEDQLNQMVVSTTKVKQRAEQAPAVVTVVNAEEIQARGLRSLADVLRTVPGFYDVYDLTFHNVGARGVSGGARAAGNVVLVMIDGMPVDDRITNGNYFGEELIPMAVVERIEIIRGPASAVYGANAYVGLVNLITKSGEKLSGARVFAHGNVESNNLGGGGGFVVGGSTEKFEALVAAQYSYLDRSGMELPDSSPRLGNASDPLLGRKDADGKYTSANDLSRPRSLFARASLQGVLTGKLSLTGSVANLDSSGEFQDYGPLTHATRIQRLNQNYRLSWDVPITERGSLQVSGSYFNAGALPDERLDIGRSDYALVRRASAQGFRLMAEGQGRPWDPVALLLGVDFQHEDHLLQSFGHVYKHDLVSPDGSVIHPAGAILPGVRSTETFRNFGGYGQVLANFNADWSGLIGARVDVHSVYGASPSARLGLVWAPENGTFSGKLMVGESYKAPSAEQLRTEPMTILDIRGNPELKVQKADTAELAGAWRLPGGLGEVTANVYTAMIRDRVEFMQTGLYLQAQNVQSEWIVGGELDSRFNLHKTFQLRFAATVARTVSRSAESDLEGMPQVTNPLFPPYQFHLLANWQLPWLGLRVLPELSYVGPRSSSQSNALEQGSDYSVPGYFYGALAVSLPPRKLFGDTETGLALRVTNVLHQRYSEPGFGGIDVPARGIGAMLTLTQSL